MIINDSNLSQWQMLIDGIMQLLVKECETNIGLRTAMRRDDKNLEDMAKYVYDSMKKLAGEQRCYFALDTNERVKTYAIEYFMNNKIDENNGSN